VAKEEEENKSGSKGTGKQNDNCFPGAKGAVFLKYEKAIPKEARGGLHPVKRAYCLKKGTSL